MISFQSLLILSLFSAIESYPCDGDYKWKCPNDNNLCLDRRYEVCSPPPYNTPRCYNGGDYGNSSCTDQLCKSMHRIKCPSYLDPFCVPRYSLGPYNSKTCTECPTEHQTTRHVNSILILINTKDVLL